MLILLLHCLYALILFISTLENILYILISLLSFSGNSRTNGNSLDRKKVVSILEEDEDASSTPEKKSSPADAVVSVVAVSSDPVKGGERPSRSGHYCNFLLSLLKTRLPLGGKSLIPHWEDTVLFCSINNSPSSGSWTFKGFLILHGALHGPSILTLTFQN